MSLNLIRTILTGWTVVIFGCNNASKKSINGLEIGRDLYYRNCLSCHSENTYGTLHKPSLIEMSKQNDSVFKDNFSSIASDTIHPFFKNISDNAGGIEALIRYIRTYKEQGIVPDYDHNKR
jgi:hypothetical protein